MDTKGKLNLVAREQVLAQVEECMLKGIQRVSAIAKEIKSSPDMAKKYMEAIWERWRLRRSIDWDSVRIELLQKSRFVEEKAWTIFEKADNSSAAIGAINSIIEIQDRQARLAGLNQILDKKN